MNELFQIQPQWARARCVRSNPLAIGVEMPDRPMRAERPFTPLLLLLAIVYLMAVLTPTGASAARLDSAEALAAWAKSKNWTKTSYGIGYKSDKINSFDIWIVYDRTPTLIPFNESWESDGRNPQAVIRTGENITIAGGIPATLLYTSLVHKDSGHESEIWEYYCHDYRVLMRAHRDTQIGQAGSDPLALLENYIAFVNKYLNVKPLSIGKTGKEDLHEIKITGGPQGSANPASPGRQIECIVAAQDSLGHQLKYKWTALGGTVGFNDPTLKRPTWTVQPNDTENIVYWPIAVEVSCDHGASAKGHYIQKVWPNPKPQLAKLRDSFNARKVKGDVQVDRGEFGMITVKEWDIIRVGDIIVTGVDSRVSLSNPEYRGSLYIEQNSRVKIIEKSALSMSQRWQRFKKVSALIIDNLNAAISVEGRPFFCLDEGTYYINNIPANGVVANFFEYFMKPLPKQPIEEDAHAIKYSGLYIEDRGTIYSVTHSKSTGEKSVSVVEGEVIAVCDLQPETVWSVKAGEKLTVDKDCGWQKSNLTTSEIQQITSLFPDVKKATRLAPIADSYVYAYAYRNWNKANWGKYGSLGAGWHPTGGEKRAYLKFDLSGIDPNIVKKATLKLYHNHTGGKNSLSVGVHAVTSRWQEGGGTYHSGQTEKPAAPGEISWVQQPTFDFSPVASFKPGSGLGKYIEVDITPLVMAWLTGKPNYGLMIKPVGIMSGRASESSYGFYSREYKDSQKRPQLFLNTTNEPIDPNDTPPVGGGSGTARLLTAKSNRDMVGRNEKFRGNGKTDAVFRAQFSAPNRTVTAVEVSNTNGLRSVWDTRPNNRLWLGGVVIEGRTMNQPDGSVNFSLGSGQSTLDFFVEDNGSIRGGKTNYRMTIFFATGDPLVMNILPANSSNTSTGTQHPLGDITKTTGTGPTGLTLDFETGKTNGWTKTGTAFDHQPTYGDNPTARHRGQPSKHVGNYWIGTYEKYQGSGSQKPGSIQGDGPTGTLTSNIFTIPPGYLSFLVGGGSSPQTRVELLVSGNSVLSVSGRGTETMHRVKWDLNPWAGQQGQIRIVDNASGGWGHINADDFRFSHSSSSGGTPGGIRIESATYGGNCGVAKGNVTAHIARQCNGKSRCRYVVNHKIIGDPAYGCAKTYTVRYRCGNNPQVLEKSLPAEAGWGDKAVLLECADSLNGDIVKPDYADGKVTSKCGLGKSWDVTEVYGWTGRWTRQGNSNVFNGLWTLGGKQEKAVLTVSINGNTVNVKRKQSAGSSYPGQECTYKGILAADNVTVTGTYGCAWAAGPFNWKATIRCDNGGGSVSNTGSLPPSQGIKKVITGYGKKK